MVTIKLKENEHLSLTFTKYKIGANTKYYCLFQLYYQDALYYWFELGYYKEQDLLNNVKKELTKFGVNNDN